VLTLITRTDRLKYLNLQRDNHLSVCIMIRPSLELCHHLWHSDVQRPRHLDEARRIIARYRAPAEVDDYVGAGKTEHGVLITVTPEHIATRVPR